MTKVKMASNEDLVRMAKRLQLSWMRDHMVEMLEQATEAKMTPRETLQFFLATEVENRDRNRMKLSMVEAHFPMVRSFEDFDMGAQPSIDPGVIRELRTLNWINNADNLLIMGPPGVGKTHLAIALGMEAIKAGLSVQFTSAASLMDTLEKAYREETLPRKLSELAKPKLLIIDEFGYLPVRKNTAHLLFQLVSRRYEKSSVLLTSNRPIGDWGVVLGDATAASAIADRLVHHSSVMQIRGDSYRLRSSKVIKMMPSDRKPKDKPEDSGSDLEPGDQPTGKLAG